MRYYTYHTAANNYAGFFAPKKSDTLRVHDLDYDDTPVRSSWRPPLIRRYPKGQGAQIDGDFPTWTAFRSIPIVSARAWGILSGSIECRWENLPIEYPGETPFYIIHVMETFDCLDVDRSEVERYDDGDVMNVERYCFKEDVLAGKHVFKLPLASGAGLFFDDVFREVVEGNDLRGLIFRELCQVS